METYGQASIWRVHLGERLPVLIIMATAVAFSRPFQVEDIDDPAAPIVLASGELTRRKDGEAPAVDFTEHFARRLKLTGTDDRNAPLTIFRISAQSAARQVIFESVGRHRSHPSLLRKCQGAGAAL